MEINFGDWEMCLWDNLDMGIWDNDWISNPPPNGESFLEMYSRVASSLDEIKTQNFSNIFIFTHAGVINCARIYFGQSTYETVFDEAIQYGAIAKFEL